MRAILYLSIALYSLFPLGAFAAPLEIQSISVSDADSDEAGFSIDTSQGTCSDSSREPFSHATMTLAVKNNFNRNVTVSRVSFTLRTAQGSVRVKRYALLSGPVIVTPGATTDLQAFLAVASAGRKSFPGSPTPIVDDLGIRTVTVSVYGADSRKRRLSARAAMTIAFANYDRC